MEYTTLGAVDLGSNSFHLAIGRVVRRPDLSARFAQGNGAPRQRAHGRQAARRARPRSARWPRSSASPSASRACRARRCAWSAPTRCAWRRTPAPSCAAPRPTLGFPIEIISGREEARLIYLGVVHSLPLSAHNRLVVDIGGGSTEFIIGNKLKPKAMESLYMGCVSYTARFFPDGRHRQEGVQAGRARRARAGADHRGALREDRMEGGVGSSGTARSIADDPGARTGRPSAASPPRASTGCASSCSRRATCASSPCAGLREDRMPVVAGGVAIMSGVSSTSWGSTR